MRRTSRAPSQWRSAEATKDTGQSRGLPLDRPQRLASPRFSTTKLASGRGRTPLEENSGFSPFSRHPGSIFMVGTKVTKQGVERPPCRRWTSSCVRSQPTSPNGSRERSLDRSPLPCPLLPASRGLHPATAPEIAPGGGTRVTARRQSAPAATAPSVRPTTCRPGPATHRFLRAR